jgi:hypothetical protein
MKRLAALAIGLGLLSAACADQAGTIGTVGSPTGAGTPPATSEPPTTPPSSTPSSPTSPTATPTSPASPTGEEFTYEVWFAYGDRLFVTKRTEPFDPAVGHIALRTLLEGPGDAEGDAGLTTAIPAGVALNGLTIDDGVATVDVTGQFDDASGSLGERMRLAQAVYTITQFPSVTGVRFELDGEPVESFGSHGVLISEPQTREDYEDLLPAILVESPLIGQPVSSPVTISGTANVFEATVSIRILDADGNVIANTFTTATCGTGCRGEYAAGVQFSVGHDQMGMIEVFESSAQDGTPINVIPIPVLLSA